MSDQIGGFKKKAIAGATILGIKRVVIQVIFTVSNIFLARLLFPTDFGTFAIVVFVVTLFSFFTDLGLGPALIQRKAKITDSDLQTVFTFQILLSLIMVVIIFIGARLFSNYFQIGDKGANLLRIYSFYLFLLPFRSTSGVLLERFLLYNKITIVEVVENVLTAVLTLFFVVFHLGVSSFVYGWLIGYSVGAILYFVFAPWKIRLNFKKEIFLNLSRFGLPFQLNSILGLFYGPFILLYLGKTVGPQNLGYFQWAAGFAVFPTVVADIINRITFPLGARVQSDNLAFRKVIEKSVMIVSASSLPIAGFMIVAAPLVINFVYTDRWLPALPAVYLGVFQSVIISQTGVFSQLLYSRGKANVMRNMGIFWAVTAWILAPILISRFNFVGMSMTLLILSGSGIWLIFRLKREVNFSWFSNFFPYLIGSVFSSLVFFVAIRFFPVSILNLIIVLSLSFTVYGCFLLITSRAVIFEICKSLLFSLKNTK